MCSSDLPASRRWMSSVSESSRARAKAVRPRIGWASSAMAADLLKTPLHALHIELGAKMVPFGGYDMPVQYASGILAEHKHTRTAAGLFDVSHMGKVRVHGPGSLDFLNGVLANDLERIAPSVTVAFEHFPRLETAGIKKVVNGPFTFAPDGNPLVGPVKGLKNYWVACGVMAGFSQGGGVGLALSQWMVNGDPGFDVWAMDCARFGEWATRTYTNEKVRENYSRRFSIRFPNEELPAGRPLRTSPIYDRLRSLGRVAADGPPFETSFRSPS